MIVIQELSPLTRLIDRRLRNYRSKEPDNWYGINQIRNGLSTKPEAKEALLKLLEVGYVERRQFTNGEFWRAKPLDIIDVRTQK